MCYTSDKTLVFYVAKEVEEEDERLKMRWGNKRRSPFAYLRGRDGDSLMVPFECDLCIFRKLKGINPLKGDAQDDIVMASIRRANLDAFWSRAEPTVRGNRSNLTRILSVSQTAGMPGPFLSRGPLPDFDHCGYEMAIDLLLLSRRKGNYSEDHIQSETLRKYSTAYANFMRASSEATSTAQALVDAKGNYTRFSNDPCGSLWFSRFKEGCKRRMGQDVRSNLAFSTELIVAMLASITARYKDADSKEEACRWMTFGAYVAFSYVLSLRGGEALLFDLGEILKELQTPDPRFLPIVLHGKLKGEVNDHRHVVPCTKETSSGIDLELWLDLLIYAQKGRGFTDGPAITDSEGKVLTCSALDDTLQEVLEDLFATQTHLFPREIKTVEDLRLRYHVFRSLRRASDTRALSKKVAPTDIDIVNRWNDAEAAKGNRPKGSLKMHYAQISILIEPFLRYGWAM
jgi:hypothetical protein